MHMCSNVNYIVDYTRCLDTFTYLFLIDVDSDSVNFINLWNV